MKKSNLGALLLLTASFSFAPHALESDYGQKIFVDADRQEVDIKTNRVTFYNNVIVSQGSIKITADHLSVIGTGNSGSDVMLATGKPATFYQVLDNGRPIQAQAEEVRYELKTRTLTLSRDAELRQEDSVISSATIQYNIEKQEMIANGGEKGRVTTVFLPQDIKELEQQLNQKK
jgi:lipopolysaccharide export system protein LptA